MRFVFIFALLLAGCGGGYEACSEPSAIAVHIQQAIDATCQE